jgi:predicted exporter
VYLFVQRSEDWRWSLWPTLRLGVLTSVAGFAARASGFRLAQPACTGRRPDRCGPGDPVRCPRGCRALAIRDLRAAGEGLARIIQHLRGLRPGLGLILVVALSVLYLHRGTLFNHELAALSPIPAAAQDLDERLRAELGAPDVRYMLLASAPTREVALEAAQALGTRLAGLVETGVLGGFESPTRYLPDTRSQHARRSALPEPAALRVNLAQALQGLPVDAAVLQPFVSTSSRHACSNP